MDWDLTDLKNKKGKKIKELTDKSGNNPGEKQIKAPKIVKPPPIILSNVKDYGIIKEKLQIEKFKCSASMLNNNQIKVNVNLDAEYRELTVLINNTNLEWHTYENKASRLIRVTARNIHPTTPAKDITKELEEKTIRF